MRTALLAAVSHDLRTPLAGIKAAVSSLRMDDVQWSAEDEAALLETIEESADRLDALLSNLLDMSRLQTGAVRPRAEYTSADDLVARGLAGVSARGTEPVAATARVVVSVEDDLPVVCTDAGLVERALANLVENALRHTQRHCGPGHGQRRSRPARDPGDRPRSRDPGLGEGGDVRAVPTAR